MGNTVSLYLIRDLILETAKSHFILKNDSTFMCIPIYQSVGGR